MSDPAAWKDIILDAPTPKEAWDQIFCRLKDLATTSKSPVILHRRTVEPDRLLCEAAWELWAAYPSAAPRTADAVKQWCSGPAATGHAVLILDALSLREMPFILGGAQSRNIKPTSIRVTGAEAPSATEFFAQALGASQRSVLANDGKPAAFAPFAGAVFTDVINCPFADCISAVPNQTNVFLWHTWLDDLIHVHKRSPDQICTQASHDFQGDGFWKFINRLRQGRKLLITSDHGYAASKLFSTEVEDPEAAQSLRETFGASRYKDDSVPWGKRLMPPLVMTVGSHHIVMGQRKWKAPGGFPQVCHGGLSLLEVAVPFIEFPPL